MRIFGRILLISLLITLGSAPARAPRCEEAKEPGSEAPGTPPPQVTSPLNPPGELPPGVSGVGSHPTPPPEVQKQIERERAADEKASALREEAQAHAADLRYQVAFVEGLLDLGRDDEALMAGVPLVEKFPHSAQLSLALGRAFLRDGQFQLAAAQFQRAIGLDGTLAKAYVLAGRTALIEGDLKTAEADLRKAISLQPELVDARSALSLVLERSDRYAQAIEVLSVPGAKGGAELSGKRALLRQFVKSPPLVLPQNFTSLTVPFTQIRGFPPMVKTLVGDSLEKHFVIDTASDEVLLTPEAAKALGLPERGRETVKDEEGREHLTPVYAVLEQMKLGEMTIHRIPVRVSPGLKYPDDRIAGALGRDFLRRFRVTLDYPGRTLTLARSGGTPLEGAHFGLASVILVEGQIGDEEVGCFVVDTSSYTPGVMDAKFVAEQTGKSLYSQDVELINQGPYLFKFTMPSLKVAGAGFQNFAATAVDLRTMSQAVGVNVRGVIGLSLLRGCRAEIDFRNQRISLTKVPPPPAPAAPAAPAS